MGLTGKKSVQIEIKSCGDAFHALWGKKPHHVSNLSPNLIKGCTLHEGDLGGDRYVASWNYFHDGKEGVVKEIIHVDDEKKTVTFDVIEGDLKELYKSLLFTHHVDKKGETCLVTWTAEYEKLHEGIPDPDSLLKLKSNLTKDIDVGLLKE